MVIFLFAIEFRIIKCQFEKFISSETSTGLGSHTFFLNLATDDGQGMSFCGHDLTNETVNLFVMDL